jgi:putative aldouronate transport system substrate-binding protein
VETEPYFDRLLEFLDWLYYSEEGMDLTTWGVEGETYEVVDGQKQFLPAVGFEEDPTQRWQFGLEMFTINAEPEFLDFRSPEEITEFLREVADRGMIAPVQPSIVVDDETQEYIDLTLPPLNDYVNTAQLQFIYGDLDLDEDWDEYIASLESRGLRELEERVNEAIQ